MIIVKYRFVFYSIIGVITALALGALLLWGIKPGIDFAGGVQVEIRYEGERPAAALVNEALGKLGAVEYSARPSGDAEYIIRAHDIPEGAQASLAEALSLNGEYSATVTQLTQIGPSIGAELQQKAFIALFLVIAGILAFITFAFRNVSRPVPSWIYGIIAIVALIHDVIVPVGAFAAMGHFFGVQADALFMTAILTILGFSIHDTIVVFDRVRENLRLAGDHHSHQEFEGIAGKSLNQTFVRSVNTSLTVAVSLLALYFFGPVSTQIFALTLLIGIVAGTFSSIALATPLLVTVANWLGKRSK